MNEFLSQPNSEIEIRVGLYDALVAHLDNDDKEFIDEIYDLEERLNYIYGRLIEEGKDPDEILQQYGVLEEGEQ